MADVEEPGDKVSFDEFKLYYESTEKVTDRRHDMNKWNYSIMVATLLGVGAILAWSISRPSNVLIGVTAVVMLSLMAAIHCTYWIAQIDDFKALNDAKFTVLSQMAPRVEFPAASPGVLVRSHRPFDREWQFLLDRHATTAIRSGLTVLKSSNAEYFIPKAFRLLFSFVVVTVLAAAAISFDQYSQHISPFDGMTTEQEQKK